MKKIIIPLIVVVVLLIGGVGAYFIFSGEKKSPTQSEEIAAVNNEKGSTNTIANAITNTVASAITDKTSYLNAIRSGQALDCRVVDPENGEVLLKTSAGFEKMRSQVKAEGMTVNSLMIDGTSYTWNEGETTGIKMTITPEFLAQTREMAEDYYTEEADAGGATTTLDCSRPTGLTFDLPKSVTFTDFSEMMNGLGIDLSQINLSELGL